jgi:DNA repair exonuclease SbcCD nuclease subunit
LEDGIGDTTLSPLRGLHRDDFVHVVERPKRVVIGDVHFACLPFTASSHGYDVEEKLREMTAASPRPRTVVLSHLNVPGIVPGEETTEMPRGREITLPEKLAHERACLVLQGHFHRRQTTPLGTRVVGSLARLTFGEENNRPGFLVVEV